MDLVHLSLPIFHRRFAEEVIGLPDSPKPDPGTMLGFRTERRYRRGQKEAHGRVNHQQAQRGGGGHRRGKYCCRGRPAPRRLGADLPPLEGRVRGPPGLLGAAPEATGNRERPPQEGSCRELTPDNQILNEAAQGNF